jgi:hypothetical protein
MGSEDNVVPLLVGEISGVVLAVCGLEISMMFGRLVLWSGESDDGTIASFFRGAFIMFQLVYHLSSNMDMLTLKLSFSSSPMMRATSALRFTI